MKNSGKLNYTNQIYKSGRNSIKGNNELTINEQISMHKLNLENAVFRSKTSRNLSALETPKSISYMMKDTSYEHKFIKNNPQ